MKGLSLSAFYALALAFVIAVVSARPANASVCRVLESRNSYLGYSSKFGFSDGIFRLRNPYQMFATSTSGRNRDQARKFLNSELAQTSYVGVPLAEIPSQDLTQARERAGIDLLLQLHKGDIALIYGSERVKSDGAIQLTYQQINLHSGEKNDKVLLVSAKEAARLYRKICAKDRCSVDEVMENPTLSMPELNALIGLELTDSLKKSCQ